MLKLMALGLLEKVYIRCRRLRNIDHKLLSC